MRYVLPLACALVTGTLSEALAQPQTKPAAPFDSTIVALERRAWEAIKRQDAAAFFAVAGPEFLYVRPAGIQRLTRAGTPDSALAGCNTRSYAIDSATVSRVGEGGAVLTYRLTLDQTCRGQLEPSPVYVTAVWARRNGRWVNVTHTETPVKQKAAQ